MDKDLGDFLRFEIERKIKKLEVKDLELIDKFIDVFIENKKLKER